LPEASVLESDLQAGAKDLYLLRTRHEQSAQHLAEWEPLLLRTAGTYAATRNQLGRLQHRQADLAGIRKQLQESIQAMEQEFARYQLKYRERLWAAAAGQQLGKLTTCAGHEYREVVIVRVTAVGFEIRHAEGTARVQTQDLEPALWERFQWHQTQASAQLHQERALQEAANPAMAATPPPVTHSGRTLPAPQDDAEVAAKQLQELRGSVWTWTAQVALRRAERNQANQGSRRMQPSVPGSLETWQSRDSRMAAALSHARANLSAAKAELAGVAPQDPCLQMK